MCLEYSDNFKTFLWKCFCFLLRLMGMLVSHMLVVVQVIFFNFGTLDSIVKVGEHFSVLSQKR